MDKKVFEAYSQYYDLLYKDKNYIAETNYIHSLITSFSSKTQTILELGCGTGIHAGYLAEAGYTVQGIDKSNTMLQLAINRQSKLPIAVSEKLSFLEGDIRTYESVLKFDTVISLFHVMSYMTEQEDLLMAIRTAKKHLKENGLFIFDCWHGPGVLNDPPISRTKTFENDAVSIKRVSIPEMEKDKHIVNVNFEIVIHNKKNQEAVELREIHPMRYLFTDELKILLENNGFELIHAEEWMTKASLSDRAWNACYVCKKL